jgi:hypothetical protein
MWHHIWGILKCKDDTDQTSISVSEAQ